MGKGGSNGVDVPTVRARAGQAPGPLWSQWWLLVGSQAGNGFLPRPLPLTGASQTGAALLEPTHVRSTHASPERLPGSREESPLPRTNPALAQPPHAVNESPGILSNLGARTSPSSPSPRCPRLGRSCGPRLRKAAGPLRSWARHPGGSPGTAPLPRRPRVDVRTVGRRPGAGGRRKCPQVPRRRQLARKSPPGGACSLRSRALASHSWGGVPCSDPQHCPGLPACLAEPFQPTPLATGTLPQPGWAWRALLTLARPGRGWCKQRAGSSGPPGSDCRVRRVDVEAVAGWRSIQAGCPEAQPPVVNPAFPTESSAGRCQPASPGHQEQPQAKDRGPPPAAGGGRKALLESLRGCRYLDLWLQEWERVASDHGHQPQAGSIGLPRACPQDFGPCLACSLLPPSLLPPESMQPVAGAWGHP
nr:translation initiation factor IF-2-like [Desmodus rotundus]